MRRTIGQLLLIFLLSQGAFALSVRTLAFRLPDNFPPQIELSSPALHDAPKTAQVAAPGFSPPFELPPGDYTAKRGQLPGLARFSLPESEVQKFVLVVISNRLEDWTIVAIPDDIRTFAKGDFHLINATPTDIGVRFSKAKTLLKSGRTAIMKMPEADFQHGQFEVEMSTVINDKLTIFNATIWHRTPKLRTLVLLYVDPKTKRYRTATIGDYEFTKKPGS